VLEELATQYGLIASGETQIDDALWSYTMAVVTLCAQIADTSADASSGRSPGDHIRAELLDYRVRQARASAP
jgi:hypothetical protein